VIVEGFHRVERFMKETSGKYSVGNEVSVADLFLVPQVPLLIVLCLTELVIDFRFI